MRAISRRIPRRRRAPKVEVCLYEITAGSLADKVSDITTAVWPAAPRVVRRSQVAQRRPIRRRRRLSRLVVVGGSATKRVLELEAADEFVPEGSVVLEGLAAVNLAGLLQQESKGTCFKSGWVWMYSYCTYTVDYFSDLARKLERDNLT